MKVLKVVLYIILFLIIAVFIAALFIKKDFSSEQSIVIKKPESLVFDYIKHLRNQNHYSKWALLDTDMKTSFTGTDATPGFISSWDGNKDVGKGEQEIKKITANRIDTELRFERPFRSVAKSYMETDSINTGETKVTWGFNGHTNYPLNIIHIFGVDKLVGSDLRTGLKNLKQILEK